MYRVFNAIYRRDNVYAEGFIFLDDNSKQVEGVFALDYMFIYNYLQKTYLSLQSCFWDYGICYSFDEFISEPVKIKPTKSFIFYDNSNETLYLEVYDEIFNIIQIQDALQMLNLLRI